MVDGEATSERARPGRSSPTPAEPSASRIRHVDDARRSSPRPRRPPTRPRSRRAEDGRGGRGPARARSARARRVPRRSPSARRPTSRTTASAPRRRPRRAGERAKAGWSASCCPWSTTSSARSARADEGDRSGRGRAAGARAIWSRVLAAQRRRAVRPERRAVRPDAARGALHPPAGGRRSRASSSTWSRRATGRTTRPASGAGGGLPVDGRRQGPVQDARRRQEGLRRRDQEGLPQARAPVPPGHATRATRRPRSASRRSRSAYDDARPTPRSASSTTGRRHLRRLRPRRLPHGRRRRGRRRLRRLRRHPLRPLRRRRAAPAAASPAPERGRDLETEVHISFEQAMEGAQVPVVVPQVPSPVRPATAPARSPAPARTVCPRCQGRGIEPQGQGLFSISQPCPQCGGTGTRDQRSLPDLPRPGQTHAGQALPREHPGGRARRQPRAPGRQGRGRDAAADRPATST